MQHLGGEGWVKATGLLDSSRIIANLIKKGWVEYQRTENAQAIASRTWGFRRTMRRFRLTELDRPGGNPAPG